MVRFHHTTPVSQHRQYSLFLLTTCVAAVIFIFVHNNSVITPCHGLVVVVSSPVVRQRPTTTTFSQRFSTRTTAPGLLFCSRPSSSINIDNDDVQIEDAAEKEPAEYSLLYFGQEAGRGDEACCDRRAFMIGTAVTMGLIIGSSSLPDNNEAHGVVSVVNSDNRGTIRITSGSETTTMNTATAATTTSASIDWRAILEKAGKRALGGGKAGASAAVVQVCSLMWLRTSMNYQYRYGGTLASALTTLWQQGGLPRLYQGLPFALVQGPLTRFGDTAANVGVLAVLDALDVSRDWPLPVKTLVGSLTAGLWRIVLMPIDASKTALQVEGPDGLAKLWTNASPSKLYQGAVAQAAATAVGHFPWFLTYNALDAQLPKVAPSDDLFLSLARSALLGFCASAVSDCASNSLRVIKTTKQTAQLTGDGRELSYPEVVRLIVATDGIGGLFGRGLQTRLLTNAIQGSVFSILWKFFESTAAVANP